MAIQCDLLVFLTPVTFGGYSSELKKAVDRMIPLALPFFARVCGETHHKPRYERYPALLGVGVLPDRDDEAEQMFTALVGRNAVNFNSSAHAATVVSSSQDTETVRGQIKTALAKFGGRG